MPYGFAIIGCGAVAPKHAAAIANLNGARLVGCFDIDPAVAGQFRAAHGGRAYASLSELLSDDNVEIVTVCTPSGAHLDPALAAAAAGKHLLVEKPLEVTLERCDRLIEASLRHGVKLATVFPLRFHDASEKLCQAILQGELGTLALGSAQVKCRRGADYYANSPWRGTWELDGGGALMNQSIHALDLLLWLMGPVESVTAHTASRLHGQIEVEDTAVATMRFVSGALGVVEASTAIYPGYRSQIAVHGSRGSVVLQEQKIACWELDSPAENITVNWQARTVEGAGEPVGAVEKSLGHCRQFSDFVAAVRDDRPPAVDGLAGRRAVELVLAMYRSSQAGQLVRL